MKQVSLALQSVETKWLLLVFLPSLLLKLKGCVTHMDLCPHSGEQSYKEAAVCKNKD